MTLLRRHRLESLIFVGVFGLCAYFYNGYGWNQTARYDAIWAFVEPGEHRYSFAIDDFITDPVRRLNTGDYARNPEQSPHYYSNKAPGSSLLGIPAYFALYHGEKMLGLDPVSPRGVLINAYLIHLWVTVLPVAASAVFFFGLALLFTRRRRRALLLTGVLYGGTLMLPFSTMLWGHTTAAAFAVMALAFFMRSGRRAAMLSGLFVGLAVLTDYGAAPLAATLALAALATDARRERLPALVLGGLGPLVFFAAYHWALFGSPFTLASSFSPAEMIEEQRLFGLFGRINPVAVWGLTVSSTRGLFFFMPVLVLSLYALRFTRSGNAPRDHVAFWWLAAANMVLIFLINTTFNGWHGGFSTGPRYQIIALPFYVLALALLPERRWVRNGLWTLAAISFVNMFVAAAVSPVAPDAIGGSPLLFCYDRIWRVLSVDLGIVPAPVGGLFSRAGLHIYPMYAMRDLPIALDDPLVERWVSFNLGERLLGLRGTLSLLPVLLGSAGVALWATRLAGEQDMGADSGGGDADTSRHDTRDARDA
jgi:hypothetical protein